MPKGVKASPAARAIAMLEREQDRIQKRLSKYDALRRDLETVRRAIAALKGQQLPVEGVDGGGINHVVVRGRKSA